MIFDGDRNALGQYVRDLADMMGLRDWHLLLLNEPTDNPEHAADIDVVYGRRAACIRFHADWAQADPSELRCTVVHELVHCHLNPMRNVLDNIENAVGKMVYDPTYNALTDYIEYATDAISTAWAESLPLPVKAAPKRKKGR